MDLDLNMETFHAVIRFYWDFRETLLKTGTMISIAFETERRAGFSPLAFPTVCGLIRKLHEPLQDGWQIAYLKRINDAISSCEDPVEGFAGSCGIL